MRVKRGARSRRRGFIITMILLVAAALLAGAGAAWWLLSSGPDDEGNSPSPGSPGGFFSRNNVAQIMVMGVDPRTDEPDEGRSDTLMVVSVDRDKESAAILSLPRDMRVAIEGQGYDKINHAYAYGGEKLTKRTVEKLLGVKLDYYVKVDIRAFRRMIDAVGGVDLDVEKRMYYEDPWDDNGGLVIDLYPGMQHLDGERAMEYVRFRDEEGDVGRIRRQQKFILALLKQVVSPQIVTHLPELTKELSGLLETNMSLSELTRYAALLPQVRKHGVKGEIFSGTPLFWEGVSYWIPDIVRGREQLAANSGQTLSAQSRSEGERMDRRYEDDMPSTLRKEWHKERELRDAEAEAAKLNAKEAEKEKAEDERKQDSDKKQRQVEQKKSETKKVLKPEDITVRVVNNSGINGAAAEIADELRKKGFNVSETVTGDTSQQEQTRVLVPAGSEDLFYGMPFACVIMVGDENRITKAELTVGKDYR